MGICRRLRAASVAENDNAMKRTEIKQLKLAIVVIIQGLTRLIKGKIYRIVGRTLQINSPGQRDSGNCWQARKRSKVSLGARHRRQARKWWQRRLCGGLWRQWWQCWFRKIRQGR
uniref:Uncharacterized protein n=1 Tax=Salix viminalis TaxID=40686 RepID=A0A6N2N072_SALVM